MGQLHNGKAAFAQIWYMPEHAATTVFTGRTYHVYNLNAVRECLLLLSFLMSAIESLCLLYVHVWECVSNVEGCVSGVFGPG